MQKFMTFSGIGLFLGKFWFRHLNTKTTFMHHVRKQFQKQVMCSTQISSNELLSLFKIIFMMLDEF